jgi:hypothetical protein
VGAGGPAGINAEGEGHPESPFRCPYDTAILCGCHFLILPAHVGYLPYFYSNPWPFEKDQLLDKPLPAGAGWFTGGWEGTIFPYVELVGAANAEERLLAYARAVYDAAAPTLMA